MPIGKILSASSVLLGAVAAYFFFLPAFIPHPHVPPEQFGGAGTIGFDNATFVDGAGGSLTVTDVHTAAGTNRLAVVCARAGGAGSDGLAAPTVTYDGVSMTQITGNVSTTVNENLWMFYLVNPPTTASANVVGTWASTGSTYNLKTATYTGVVQTSPLDTSAVTGPSTTASFAQTLTTTVTNDWMMTCARSGNAMAATAPAQIRTGSVYLEADSATDLAAGSNTITLTQTSAVIAGIAAAFKPLATATASFAPWQFDDF